MPDRARHATLWKALGLILVVLVIAVSGFVAAVCSVKLRDPALAQGLYLDTMDRVRREDARDPRDNGFAYLETVLQQSSSADDFRCLNRYSVGDKPQCLAEARKNPVQFQADLQRFLKVRPHILKAVGMARFKPTLELDKGLLAPAPNFLMYRGMAQSLVIYGYHLEQEGRPAEAAEQYLVAVEMGGKLGRNTNFIGSMIAIAILQIGLEPLAALIDSGRLDPVSAATALRRLTAVEMEDQDYLRAMDAEYAATVTTFNQMLDHRLDDLLAADPESRRSMTLLLRFRPYVAREKFLYQNLYLKHRPTLRRMQPLPDWEDEVAALRSNYSLITSLVVPNVTRSYDLFRATLTQLNGVRLVAALHVYRQQHGAFPPTLTALAPHYLPHVPRDYMNQKGRFEYKPMPPAECRLTSESVHYAGIGRPTVRSLHPFIP